MDPTLWKINGIPVATLAIESPRLRLVNGAADVLSWDDPAAAFDADLRWAYDAPITFTRGATVLFRGKIRRTPRFVGARAESITYAAHGPWAWLEERAYLQSHLFAVDPLAAYPALAAQLIGRAIIGQRLLGPGSGTKINISAALAEIIASADAGVTVGTITGLDWPIPLDEAVDLQVTDALGRVLQWAPDAVEWYDYAGAQPAYNAARRADLAAVTLTIPAPGAGGRQPDGSHVPLESVQIEPSFKLQAPAVVLFFRRAVDGEFAVWAVIQRQAAPVEATGREPRAIVRTIDLAGEVPGEGRLTQPVKTEALSDLLQSPGTILPATGEAGNAFNALSIFWRRKIPRLRLATITGFQLLTRVRVPNGADDPNQSTSPTAGLARELVQGAITDWMLQQHASLRVETQVLTCRVAFTETVEGVPVNLIENYTTRVTATNAATRIYRARGGVVEVGTDAEPAMPGLAQRVFDGVKDLHYDGTFVLVEREATVTVRPGLVVNLVGSRAEWTAMRALVQTVEVDIDAGRTTIAVGPPNQLGPQEFQELFRSNRTRKDITSAYSRLTGQASQGNVPVAP